MIKISNIRMKPKLIAIFLFVGVLPIIVFSGFFGHLAKKSLLESSMKQIMSIHEMESNETEEHFKDLVKDVELFANSKTTYETIRLANKVTLNNVEEMAQMLRDNNHVFDTFFKIQHAEIVKNIQSHNYDDIYIIDPVTGYIMYTANDVKSRGLSVFNGKFADSMFAKILTKTIKVNSTVLSDLSVLPTAVNKQMAMVAHPIKNIEGELEAVLMLTYGAGVITHTFVEDDGRLGETGETYIFAWEKETDTYELRSGINDKYGIEVVVGEDLPPAIYWQDAVAKGLDGGYGHYKDSQGTDVLVVYNQLDMLDLDMFLVSKVDTDEVLAPLAITYRVIIAFVIIFCLFAILLAVWLAGSMIKPISESMEYADAVANGSFDGDIDCERKDEVGDLGRSLRSMSEKLFAVDWIRKNQEDLDNLLRGNQEIQAIAEDCINFFVENLSASLGLIYLNNSGILELKASHSYDKRKGHFSSFGMGDGIVGQAALENKVLFFSEIPDGPSYNYGVGEREMVSIVAAPISKDGEVLAVILLGSFQEFSELEEKFIRQNVENIATLFSSAEAREHIAELLNKSQKQQLELKDSNDQLEEQKLDLQASESELQAQQEELRVTNEELVEQTRALQSSEKELQAQQEELRVTNEDLAAKSTDLEKQQLTIATKNNELEEAKKEVEKRMLDVEQASKYKSEFLSNMSHELRTPLNSILILSQLLSKNKSGNLTEKQKTSAKAIHASGADLLNLINEILDLSKIEAGKIELNIEKITFKKIEDDLNRLYGEMATQKGLSFSINKGVNLPSNFVSDNQRLQQILRNLVSNALKFTSIGEVKVDFNLATSSQLSGTILEGKNALCFAVTDEGIGIPKDKHDDVFNAFQQADGSTSRTFGGTGLGLSISKELTKILGGFLLLDSKENVGSTFSIFIPVTYESNDQTSAGLLHSQVEIAEQEKKPIKEQPASNVLPQIFDAEDENFDDRKNITPESKSLLIIEDDNNFAKVLMDFGRERGFDCLVAGDGETGLHFADYYLPSAIILDINLPGINGWDVMERLKGNRQLRHIPVHFISAEDISEDAKGMGAVGFLTKPISIEKMEETLSKLERLCSTPVRKLLVVEDDEIHQESIKELIGDHNVEINTVGSGEEAYQFLIENSCDCIILDLGLGDISGFELLERIRTNDSIQQIPIIVYTGRDLSLEEESELKKYADSIIIKGAKSAERLLDESALFLHRVEADLPEEKRQMLKNGQNNNSILNGITLLIVDDDMRNIFALTSILEEQEIDVIVARDGVEALRKLEENGDRIDGVLMDIMMPNMDGYEAITNIRQEMKLTKLPIIALTAKAMKDDRMKCIDVGANDYLAKPIDEEKLISILKVWLYR